MEKKPTPLTFLNQTTTKEEAVAKTTQWRSMYKEKMECSEENILRAWFIPIDDIIELYNFYKESGVGIKGVRGYIGHPVFDPVTPYVNAEMFLVPVGMDNKDILEAPAALKLGSGTSTIYDFTTPCPTDCDTSSALYSATNAIPGKK